MPIGQNGPLDMIFAHAFKHFMHGNAWQGLEFYIISRLQCCRGVVVNNVCCMSNFQLCFSPSTYHKLFLFYTLTNC